MASGHIITSTPKVQDNNTTALRELRWNIIEKVPLDSCRKKLPINRSLAKENSHRTKQPKKILKFNSTANYIIKKRRKQAVESMRLAEQRRLRKLAQNDVDKLTEDMDKLNIGSSSNNSDYLPDGRLKLTKKQLIRRDLKQKRVRKYFNEQQSRKDSLSKHASISLNRSNDPHPKHENIVENPKIQVDNKPTAKNIIRYSKLELLELCPYGVYCLR